MRNFGQGQTEYRIFDADTMEELKGKEYLFESDQQAFENTVSMTQAEIRTGREMKEVLQNSMANLRSSKDAAIDLRKAIDHLKVRRRQKRKILCLHRLTTCEDSRGHGSMMHKR